MSLYVGIEHDNYTKFAQVCGIPFLLLRLKYTTMFDKHYRASHVLVDWVLSSRTWDALYNNALPEQNILYFCCYVRNFMITFCYSHGQ